MTESESRPMPAWVYKRDGRLVPFEADKISRALFSTTERMGSPDAFLARELTDGVVHFLASECDGATPTTSQIAESVVRIVRELGQPALGLAFEEATRQRQSARETVPAEKIIATKQLVVDFSSLESPSNILQRCARTYSQEVVFARDIVAAHQEGLLVLTALETPDYLAGRVLEQPPPGNSLTKAFFDAQEHVSNTLVIDGPEFLIGEYLRSIRREQNELANSIVKRWWLRELATSLPSAGFDALINLNCLAPPLWAEELASGPLFVDQLNAPDPKRQSALSFALLMDLLQADVETESHRVQINWHLSERDFTPENEERLAEIAQLACDRGQVTFVFDRSRQAVSLGEGMDRRNPAILTTIGLNLPRLAEKQGVLNNPAKFLDKLGSLARLAISAATQKRDFLRQMGKNRPALIRGFLVERARLLVAPIGLEHVVRSMTGEGVCQELGLRFAKQIAERLLTILNKEGQACRLGVTLGSSLGQNFSINNQYCRGDENAIGPQAKWKEVAGLVPWDWQASWKTQLKAGSAIQAVVGQGVVPLIFGDDTIPASDELKEIIAWTWKNTDLTSLRLVRSARFHQQLKLGIGE
jgi:hypothetical protein